MEALSNDFELAERSPLLRMVLAVLALAGVLNATYLSIHRWLPQSTSLKCGIVGNCEAVQASAYSVFPPNNGIPVAYIGLAGWIVLLGLSLLSLQRATLGRWQLTRVVLLLASGGVAFSAYLTAIEAWVLHEWCQWCIISAILMTVFWLVAFIDWRQERGFNRASSV